jgi:predicted Fe-Mo cluster-binding NifX family protein
VPWHLSNSHQGCAGWAVVKDADGSVVGCHKTRDDALRQLAALNINVREAEMDVPGWVTGLREWLFQEADWTTAYKNNLPDSAFLYIEPGGHKDGEGKTVPRDSRHFPVRDANGKLDETHVRAALQMIPQSTVPPAAKSSALAEAKRLAKSLGINVSEAASMDDEFHLNVIASEIPEPVTLLEASSSQSKDGIRPIRIIKPGWGASGFYSADILSQAATSGVFPKGTKMYWDHPTMTEAEERPERSLRDLAAVFESDARWDPKGPAGPGLYAEARVFPQYREAVTELGPYIGPSIRAFGEAHIGEAEGKKGPIVDRIVRAHSVDFVTTPGAGGEILQLFEAAGRKAVEAANPSRREENDAVELQEALRQLQEATGARDTAVTELNTARTQLQEAQTELARFREAALLREASDFVRAEMGQYPTLPELTKTRLVETLGRAPKLTDKGELDKDGFKAVIKEAVASEVKYLSEVLGSGRVAGMGGGSQGEGGGDTDYTKQLSESFRGLGLDEKAAAIAGNGRI